jgi:hypothetical protein
VLWWTVTDRTLLAWAIAGGGGLVAINTVIGAIKSTPELEDNGSDRPPSVFAAASVAVSNAFRTPLNVRNLVAAEEQYVHRHVLLEGATELALVSFDCYFREGGDAGKSHRFSCGAM